jgi:RNA polymerase sporulation-specific sigma factor
MMIEKTKLEDINDYELIELYRENNEQAKDFLYTKYSYIVNVLICKYSGIYHKLKIDKQELHSTALLGFTDALNNYRDDKDSSLPTFISICIERRLYTLVKAYLTDKHKVESQIVSLSETYGTSDKPLFELLSDEGKHDPLISLSDEEEYNELEKKIGYKLSIKEKEVFDYLIKGYNYKEIASKLNLPIKSIDNTIQRIKIKIKKIIEE